MLSEVEKLKRRWEREDNAEIEVAVNALLQVPNGRRFLWWLLAVGKIGNQPFSPEASITAFNCGELNVGNQIMGRLMEVNPDGYTAMMKDMLNDRNSRDRELDAATDRERDARESGDWDTGGEDG